MPEVRIESFDFAGRDRLIARKYEVVSHLGAGWEGEVYKIRERNTKIERAAKLFFPAHETSATRHPISTHGSSTSCVIVLSDSVLQRRRP